MNLSRIRSVKPGELYRLNMPFELGIGLWSRPHINWAPRKKEILVLTAKPHDYKKALSDLAGIDAKSHGKQTRKRRSSSSKLVY